LPLAINTVIVLETHSLYVALAQLLGVSLLLLAASIKMHLLVIHIEHFPYGI